MLVVIEYFIVFSHDLKYTKTVSVKINDKINVFVIFIVQLLKLLYFIFSTMTHLQYG